MTTVEIGTMRPGERFRFTWSDHIWTRGYKEWGGDIPYGSWLGNYGAVPAHMPVVPVEGI